MCLKKIGSTILRFEIHFFASLKRTQEAVILGSRIDHTQRGLRSQKVYDDERDDDESKIAKTCSSTRHGNLVGEVSVYSVGEMTAFWEPLVLLSAFFRFQSRRIYTYHNLFCSLRALAEENHL